MVYIFAKIVPIARLKRTFIPCDCANSDIVVK